MSHVITALKEPNAGNRNDNSYIPIMNRRRFIQSLVAVFSLPAVNPVLSMQPAAATIPGAVTVPAKARSWATYISALHGECTPQTLQNLMHIPAIDAKSYIGQLIAEGAIKPGPLLQKSMSKLAESDDDNLVSKVKKRLEMKKQSVSHEIESSDEAALTRSLDGDNTQPGNNTADVQAEAEGTRKALDQ